MLSYLQDIGWAHKSMGEVVDTCERVVCSENRFARLSVVSSARSLSSWATTATS